MIQNKSRIIGLEAGSKICKHNANVFHYKIGPVDDIIKQEVNMSEIEEIIVSNYTVLSGETIRQNDLL